MTTIDLDALVLKHGSHKPPPGGWDGLPDACVMEAVSYVAGEPWSDRPQCASRILTSFLINLNDRWDDDDRQLLKPFIPRLVGTNTGTADEEKRRWMIADWLVHEYAPAIFRVAGMTDEAEQFEQLAAITSGSDWQSARTTIRAVRDAAWARRKAARERLDAVAVAVAVAAAVAVADAAAVAVADADAAAVAAAAAAADAAAAAVADAAAAAVAAAVADAAADADAAKFREATAAAVAVRVKGGGYNEQWDAAYAVLRPFYDERYREVFKSVGGLRESVLGLIDRLIDVGKAAA